MQKKPRVWVTLLTTVIVLVFIYFTVYTLASNEEIVYTEEIELPLEVEAEVGLELVPKTHKVDIEVKGTKEMMRELGGTGANVKASVSEIEGVDIYESEEEDRVNLKDKYNINLEVDGLEGYVYNIISEVGIDIYEVEGVEVELKVKIRGEQVELVEDIEILEDVVGYFTEQDREQIKEVSVYVDVDNVTEDNIAIGELGIEGKDGEVMDVGGRLSHTEVGVKVKFSE